MFCPTKSQEIAHLHEFLNALPADCYLRDILADTAVEVEKLIRDDMVMPLTVTAAYEARRHEETAIANLRAEGAALRAQISRMQSDRDKLETAIADLKLMARKIAGV